MKAPSALQRGMACLSCRKRKMRCDGARPVCTQCNKTNRASECQYHEKKRTSRTQMLQVKITKLEARLRELEAEQSQTDESSSGSPEMHGAAYASMPDAPGYADGSAMDLFGDASMLPEFMVGSSQDLAPLDILSGAVGPADSEGFAWADGLFEFPMPDDFTPSDPSLSGGTSSVSSGSVGGFMNWWDNDDVLCENKQMLIDIFLAHRQQCAFDVHVGRFRTSLMLPADQRPHPSLLHAIFVIGCFFSQTPALAELESHFLTRSLRAISEALQNSDRIMHVLQASCLLGTYFFWHARTLEGYYHSSIAARLAVGLELHQIRSDDWFNFQYPRPGASPDAIAPLKATVPLPPPLDKVEYAERVAAFWQIFAVDRAWAVATGLPTALPDDDHPRSRIETLWPMPIPDDPEPALDGMLLPTFAGSHLSGSTGENTLRMKAVALLERSARSSPNSSLEDQRGLELSIAQFTANLRKYSAQPPYCLSPVAQAGLQSMVYAAMIYLHRDGMDAGGDAYQKCVMAASGMVTLVPVFTDADYLRMCPIIATNWRAAAEVYVRVLRATVGTPGEAAVDLLEQELDVLMGALRRLGAQFPVSRIYAEKLDRDRASASVGLPAGVPAVLGL